jgi:ribonuclease D
MLSRMKALGSWFKQLFKFPPPEPPQRPRHWPTKEAIVQLPPFQGLEPRQVAEIGSAEAARRAQAELAALDVVGFDTESRPTFRVGEVSRGPHVVQFSTPGRAYVFVLHDPECRRIAGELIALESLKKVGFGLGDDVARIRAKLQVEPRNVHDLEAFFAEKGHGRGVGAKVGIALLFKRRLLKSKKLQTSNWGARRLSSAQIIYAANDAHAAIRCYNALREK